MHPPNDTPATPPAPEPGEPRRVLDRPPSERYAAESLAAAATPPRPAAERAVRALVAALIGAAVVAVLGGPLSVTVGLVVAAAVIGWAVGTLGRPSLGLAVGLAVGSVALGLIGIWLFARLEGGVLDLPEYFAEVQGPLVLIELAVAGLVSAATVR